MASIQDFFINFLLKNCRKPAGFFGRLLAKGMNTGHSHLTDWGLQHISVGWEDIILDVGCGGGGTVRKLAAMAVMGEVYGIDYSKESVSVSRETNMKSIRSGKVAIQLASVPDLPFHDDFFDLATAIETHYFWQDIVAGLQEVKRVLKPSGKMLLIGEIYQGSKQDERNQKWIEAGNMANHSVKEFGDLFSAAGYINIEIFEDYERGWICGTGTKAGESVA